MKPHKRERGVIDLSHSIGNPLFALETNLESLRRRAARLGELSTSNQATSLVLDICTILDEMKISIERIKDVIKEPT